jgi:hypothetical protein
MQEDFKEYLKEARQRFCKEVNKYNVSDNLQLRTECDSFLIAYDQAVAKAFSLQGVSHQRELLKGFANYLQSDTGNLNYDFTELVSDYLDTL